MTEHSKPHLVLIRPQGLHKLVVEQIQQMIIEGVLAPGTRLNERLLCEELGVSRTPLREALKVLAAEGLVNVLQQFAAERKARALTRERSINADETVQDAPLDGGCGQH